MRTRVRRHRHLIEYLVELGLGLLYGGTAAVVALILGGLAFCTTPPGP